MEHITKSFLESVLKQEIENFHVNPGSNAGDGYTSLLFTIDLTLKNTKEVRHLLLKCYSEHPARQEFVSRLNVFTKELHVYNTLIPNLNQFQIESKEKFSSKIIKLPFPTFVYGKAVDYSTFTDSESKYCKDVLENCIIMEDLRKSKNGGFRLANRIQGLDLDHCKLVMGALAKLHGITWVYRNKLGLNRLSDKLKFLVEEVYDHVGLEAYDGFFDGSQVLFKEVIETQVEDEAEKLLLLDAIEKVRPKLWDFLKLYVTDKGTADASMNKDNCLRVPGEVRENECEWRVIVHLDSRLDNMMFRYDDNGKPVEVILVDLQTMQEGDPITDICYAVFTSTNASPRIHHMEKLLKLYADTFVGICENFQASPPADFNLPELQRRFHRSKVFGFTHAFVMLPIMLIDPNDQVNMEKLGDAAVEEEMTKEFASRMKSIGENERFKMCALDLIREVYSEGII